VSLGIDFRRPDTFSYPIERGRVLNWEGVEHIWSFVLESLRGSHDDSPVMVTECPLRTPSDRQKTMEVRPSVAEEAQLLVLWALIFQISLLRWVLDVC
jgi:hypothetical protein